jgi:perosamine synthetase
MIPLDSPLLAGNEKKYLNECIDTNWISWQGKYVSQLETALAEYCQTRYSVSIVSGTNALILALQALGVGAGDEVIVPTFTMSASCFPITTVGAKVVWVDTAPNSLNSSAEQIAKKITDKTKAIIVVHLYGIPVDVEAVNKIANGIPVIEDAAESLGAEINGRRVGGIGMIGIHSFHNKIIGSGEGGAITTNNPALYEKILKLRVPVENNDGGNLITLNNRMSNLAAAVALAQLENIEKLIFRRRYVAHLYKQYFSLTEIRLFDEKQNARNVYWRYQISQTKIAPAELCNKLRERDIEARPVFTPMHLHPVYNTNEHFINAETVSQTTVDLPSGPSITDKEVLYVAEAVKELLE